MIRRHEGYRYDQQRPVKSDAALIRADIRTMVAAGMLPDESVVNVAARAYGYQPSTPGIIGSGLSQIIAFQRASAILKALGVPLHLSASTLRRWCAGEVIHLGPEDINPHPRRVAEPDVTTWYVRCDQDHRRLTAEVDSACPECGGQAINAYRMPSFPSTCEPDAEAVPGG